MDTHEVLGCGAGAGGYPMSPFVDKCLFVNFLRLLIPPEALKHLVSKLDFNLSCTIRSLGLLIERTTAMTSKFTVTLKAV